MRSTGTFPLDYLPLSIYTHIQTYITHSYIYKCTCLHCNYEFKVFSLRSPHLHLPPAWLLTFPMLASLKRWPAFDTPMMQMNALPLATCRLVLPICVYATVYVNMCGLWRCGKCASCKTLFVPAASLHLYFLITLLAHLNDSKS